MLITKAEFLEDIRKKFPDYQNIEDNKLYDSIIEEYPDYKQYIRPEQPSVEVSNGNVSGSVKNSVTTDLSEDLYNLDADTLLQNEMDAQDLVDSNNKDVNDFYETNVNAGLVNPDETSVDEFKKDYNPFKINTDQLIDERPLEGLSDKELSEYKPPKVPKKSEFKLDLQVDSDYQYNPKAPFKLGSGSPYKDYEAYKNATWEEVKENQSAYINNLENYIINNSEENEYVGPPLQFSSDEGIKEQYDELKKQGVLKPYAESDDIPLEEYIKYIKEQETIALEKKATSFIDNNESIFLRTKDGWGHAGQILDYDKDSNIITLDLLDGKQKEFKQEDIDALDGFSANLDRSIEFWDGYVDENYPEFNIMGQNTKNILYNAVIENDYNAFIGAYLLNQPIDAEILIAGGVKVDGTRLTEDNISEFSGENYPYMLKKTALGNVIYNVITGPFNDVELNDAKSKLEQYMYNVNIKETDNGKEYYIENIRPRLKDSKGESTREELSSDEVDPLLAEIKDLLLNPFVEEIGADELMTLRDVNIRPDLFINNEQKNKAHQLYLDIKSVSPDYLLGKASNDALKKNYTRIFGDDEGFDSLVATHMMHQFDSSAQDFITKYWIGPKGEDSSIDLTNIENKIPESFKLIADRPIEYRTKLKNIWNNFTAKKPSGTQGFSIIDDMVFNQDGTVGFGGYWTLNQKSGSSLSGESATGQRYISVNGESILMDVSGTDFIHPLSFTGGGEKENRELIDMLVTEAIDRNTTKIFPGKEKNGESGEITLEKLSSVHFANQDFYLENGLNIRVVGQYGVQGVEPKKGGGNWYWEYIPGNTVAAFNAQVDQDSYYDYSFGDALADFGTGVTTTGAFVSQFVSYAPSILASGFYGGSQFVKDAANGEGYSKVYDGYNNVWGDKMMELAMPLVQAGGQGDALVEATFYPMMKAIEGVEYVGDAINDYRGDRWVGDTFKVAGTAGVIYYGGRKVYAPMGKVAYKWTTNNMSIGLTGVKFKSNYTFAKGVKDFTKEFRSYTPSKTAIDFTRSYLLKPTSAAIRAKIKYPIMKTKLYRSIADKFNIDYKSQFALVKSNSPWGTAYNRKHTTTTQDVVKFQWLPNFKLEFGIGKFKISKEFKFKEYKYKFKRLSKKEDTFFKDEVLPELLDDFGTLNYIDFKDKYMHFRVVNGKKIPSLFEKYGIKESEVFDWHRQFTNSKDFAHLSRRFKDSYREQFDYYNTHSTKEYYAKYGEKGSAVSTEIPIDVSMAENTIVAIEPHKNTVSVRVENKDLGFSVIETYPSLATAQIAVHHMNSRIGKSVQLFKNEVNKAHSEQLDNFLANNEKNTFTFYFNKQLVPTNLGMDRVTVNTITIPDASNKAIWDATNSMISNNFKLFQSNKENVAITVEKAKGVEKGLKKYEELLSEYLEGMELEVLGKEGRALFREDPVKMIKEFNEYFEFNIKKTKDALSGKDTKSELAKTIKKFKGQGEIEFKPYKESISVWEDMIQKGEKLIADIIGADGAKISVEILTPKNSRELTLDFAKKNNSTVTDGNGKVVQNSDGDIHFFEKTEKLITHASNLIQGNPLKLNTPSAFEKAYEHKKDLSHSIDNTLLHREELLTKVDNIKKALDNNTFTGRQYDKTDIALINDKVKQIDKLLEILYKNLEDINNAFTNGQVPIDVLYHGSGKTKKVTTKKFDPKKDKIYSKVEDGSPIDLVKKLDPKLWNKLMKSKKYKERAWAVATQLLQAYIAKNPKAFEGSDYMVFRRNDNKNIQVPEFYNIKDKIYYSPSHDVATLYSRASGRNQSPISVPEIDVKYSSLSSFHAASLKAPVKKAELGDYAASLKSPTRPSAKGNEIVVVDVAKADKLFSKDEGYYFKKGDYSKRDAISKAIENKGEMTAPIVSIVGKGDKQFLSFTDGRHRFAQLRDAGANKIALSMSKESAAKMRNLGLDIIEAKPKAPVKKAEKILKRREEKDAKLREKYGDDIVILRDELKGKEWSMEGSINVSNRVKDPSLPIGTNIISIVDRPAIWKDGKLIKSALVQLKEGTRPLTYKEELAKYKEDLKQWKEEEIVRKEIGMKPEPRPVKPKAPVVKKKLKPTEKVKTIATVDIKKKKIQPLTGQQLAELTPDAQIAYLRRKKGELESSLKEKVEKRKGEKIVSPGIEEVWDVKKQKYIEQKVIRKQKYDYKDYLKPHEKVFLDAIELQITRVSKNKKIRKDMSDLFTWYKPGTGNQQIPVKMPIEVVLKLKDLEPLSREIASSKKQLESIPKFTDAWYHIDKQLKKAIKNHDEYHRENLEDLVSSLDNTIKELKSDLKVEQSGQLKLTGSEIKMRKNTVEKAIKLRKNLKKALNEKLTLDEMMTMKAEIVPGLNRLLNYMALRKRIAKKRKRKLKLTAEQVDFIVDSKFQTMSVEGYEYIRPEEFTANLAYRKAFDIYHSTEAKLFKELKFGEKLQKEVGSIEDSWDIISYIENKILGKEIARGETFVIQQDTKTGNPFIKNDNINELIKRINKNPKLKKIANEYQKRIEKVRQDVNNQLKSLGKNEYIAFLENYIPHMWDISTAKFTSDFLPRWLNKSPQMKKRKIPTYAEGIALGLKPKIMNLAEMYNKYIETNLIMARNQHLMHMLENSKDSFGQSVVLTKQTLLKRHSDFKKELDKAISTKQPPELIETLELMVEATDIKNYKEFKQEFLTRVLGQDKSGAKLIEKTPVWVQKDFAEVLTPLLPNIYWLSDKPVIGSIVRQWYNANNLLRGLFFPGSMFHFGTLLESSITTGARGKNLLGGVIAINEIDPRTGKKKLFQSRIRMGRDLMKTENYQYFIRRGMTRDVSTIDYQHKGLTGMMEKMIRTVKYGEVTVGGYNILKNDWVRKSVIAPTQLLRIPKGFLEFFNRKLWTEFHPAVKLSMIKKQLDVNLKDKKNLTQEQIYAIECEACGWANDSAGGQPLFKPPITLQNRLWNNPNFRRRLGGTLLAPDWTISVINQFYKAFHRSKKWARYYNIPDKDFKKINRGSYTRAILLGGTTLVSLIELINWSLHKTLDEDSEDYQPFDDGFLNVSLNGMLDKSYDSGVYELLGYTDKEIKRLKKRNQEKSRVISLGKQIKEVTDPLWDALDAGIGVLFGNNLDKEYNDFLKEEKNIFASKLGPMLQASYEMVMGETVGGFKKAKADFGGSGFSESVVFGGQLLKEKLTPVVFRSADNQFLLTFPVKQKLNLHDAANHIDRLLANYVDQDAEYDLRGTYGKAFTNYDYPDYVDTLSNLMPDLLKEIKKHNPDTDVAGLFEYRVNEAVNHYTKQFWDAFNPKGDSKGNFSMVDTAAVMDASLKLSRLHITREKLYAKLKARKFDVNYNDYDEYNKFIKEMYSDKKDWIIPGNGDGIPWPFYEGNIPTKFGTKLELRMWKGVITHKDFWNRKEIIIDIPDEYK